MRRRSVDQYGRTLTLRAHHVDLLWGIEEDAGSRWVMLHDPAGNLIELVHFKHSQTDIIQVSTTQMLARKDNVENGL
jgi:hypothetical protein